MNPFVFAAIAPHGSEIIAELSGHTPALMARTRASLQALGRQMSAASPDTLIVLTPHGTRVEGQFAIANPERMYGTVEHRGSAVSMERTVDRELAQSIAEAATQAGIPAALLNYATNEGPLSCLPLDWGAIIPLHFMPEVPVVVINPPRGMDFTPHLRFGAALSRAVAASGKRVGLIASCDWSHAHQETGPYGHHEAAEKLDARVVEHLQSGDLEALTSLPPQLIEDAKPDGLWQTLVLAGAIPPEERQVEFLSYEVPTYFGLMCAGFAKQPSPLTAAAR